MKVKRELLSRGCRITCRSQQEAERLMSEFCTIGYMWNSGESPAAHSYYEHNRKGIITYRISQTGKISYTRGTNKKAVEYRDIFVADGGGK